jgi:DNA polymerase-1
MEFLALDTETDGLNASRIWVICAEDIDTGEQWTFLNPSHIQEEKDRFIDLCKSADKFVMHNGLGFDAPVVNRLIAEGTIDLDRVVDTLVVSRLVKYDVEGGSHSLDAWGQRLGFPKGKHSDWSKLSQEMIDYCRQDVNVLVKLFKKFTTIIKDPDWQLALETEHKIQILCEEMTTNGFAFDKPKAEVMLNQIEREMDELEVGFKRDFPPKLTVVNELLYRVHGTGEEYATVKKAKEKYVTTDVQDGKLLCYDWVDFDPASPKQRIDRLWEAGWKPVDKTKGHIQWEREQRDRARQAWRKVS